MTPGERNTLSELEWHLRRCLLRAGGALSPDARLLLQLIVDLQLGLDPVPDQRTFASMLNMGERRLATARQQLQSLGFVVVQRAGRHPATWTLNVDRLFRWTQGISAGDRVAGCFFPYRLDGEAKLAYVRDALDGAIDGMLAEEVVLRGGAVVRLPDYMTYEEAATLPCAALTAWNAMFVQARLVPGQSVPLLGTGGVSIAGLQLGQVAGVRTLITSRSDAKLGSARALGADVAITAASQSSRVR